jgi:hypothetical protein
MARSNRRKTNPSLGVDWHLPTADRTGQPTGFAKRRFATTTPATAYGIEILAAEGFTWAQIEDEILYDHEAKAVARGFIDAGYGDVQAGDHMGLPPRPRHHGCPAAMIGPLPHTKSA